MSEVSMMGTCLLNMPYEILFEIFRRLRKRKLIEISKLSSKFRDIAGDTRLWKNLCFKYEKSYFRLPPDEIFAFEDLYSGPWPVAAIDLYATKINPPVSSKTDHQVLKVTTLNLTSIKADKVTMEAILAKYQCTELYLDCNQVDLREIAPETFSNQTALEVLSLRRINRFNQWLAQVLSNCKNLKILDLSYTKLTNDGIFCFVRELPTSLEKLILPRRRRRGQESYFELLTEKTPNLKELGYLTLSRVKCPFLLKFQFLETLHIAKISYPSDDHLRQLYIDLMKFPAVKTIVLPNVSSDNPLKTVTEAKVERLRTMLEPHGIIIVRRTITNEVEEWSYPGEVWKVCRTLKS